MTENNWTTCPKCYGEEVARLQKTIDNVAWNYGKVPQHEWLEMFNSLGRVDEPEIDFDLQEDYEIGFGTDGIFHILYWGWCAKCGFEFEFISSDPLPAHDVA
ncbi:hypothetical protein LCGC14_2325760 [marine sediment metagenome]|uniref:Uncharacterized protein n=1 Tax=marine sediment metagenome TaxID=412755 RepID=A0A0F9ETW8_9ZZZZ